MAEIFGLDHGTTNTLAAVHYAGEAQPNPFLDGGRPHPSVVRYHGSQVIVGRQARDQLDAPEVGVIGNFVRSPKRFLGKGAELNVGGVARDPSEVVAEILRHVRGHAEEQLGGEAELANVVATVPVSMDGRGRRALRRAAQLAGFDIHQFVHEPLAALYGYLRAGEDFGRRMAELEGRLALVFDWGGGTLDLTLCRVTDGSLLQIHNVGDPDVGGDRFDERLMRLLHQRHVGKHHLPGEPTLIPGAPAKLNAACELAKIRLSRAATAEVLVAHYADEDGEARTLEARLTREDVEASTRDLVKQGLRAIDRLLAHVEVPAEAVELCLATGGMIQMPAIRAGLIERFGGPGRVPLLEHGDRIIAEGAAWIASDGQPLTLAKPFELLHADASYVPLLQSDLTLPTLGKTVATSFSMYCVDPRDGYARFLFARPASPDRVSATDARDPYAVAVVGVDPSAQPLLERLELKLGIDHDLIAHVDLTSSLVQDSRSLELHDLEFGLHLGRR
jgi:molecular chaperone DnaK (HSP70)